jgi:D-sedoheptulose 7-phosphate isomerase
MDADKISLELIDVAIEHHKSALTSLRHNIPNIVEGSNAITDRLSTGGKVFVCGNGGSASDAQHFVAELVGRFVSERKGLPAVALTTDTSIITAVANDYSFDEIFARQIEALCGENDVLVAISTSGNSKNILRALMSAKKKGCLSILLSGKDGGQAKALADTAIIIESGNTAAIQEMHIMILHMICGIIDEHYGKSILNSING